MLLEQCPSWFDSTVGTPRATGRGKWKLPALLTSFESSSLVLEGWKLDPCGVGQWPVSADEPQKNWRIMKQSSEDSDNPGLKQTPPLLGARPNLHYYDLQVWSEALSLQLWEELQGTVCG